MSGLLDFVWLAAHLHHRGGSDRRIESILLSDADALDFLCVVGVLRDFAKKPEDLRDGYKTVRARMEKLPKLICLEKTKELAAQRMFLEFTISLGQGNNWQVIAFAIVYPPTLQDKNNWRLQSAKNLLALTGIFFFRDKFLFAQLLQFV